MKNKISALCAKCSDIPVIGALLKPKQKIAVLRLSGVIADSSVKRGGISHHKFAPLLEEAFDLYNAKAVALIINSPGGSPAQSALIGDLVRRLAEEKELPVYAFVEDVAASGGYWLACAADKIYANRTSIIGSIGVISAGFGMSELIAKHGIERRVHTSGKDKSFLDPFTEEKPADVKRLKALQKDLHHLFIEWVKSRRDAHLEADDKTLFEGAFWTADSAKNYGLIDGFGEIKAVMKAEFGDEVKFVELSPEKGFISSLLNPEARSSIAAHALDVIEEKAIWARFGL